MKFFTSTKASPPVPPAANKVLTGLSPANKAMSYASQQAQQYATAAQSPVAKPEEQQAPSNQRFRSFAERYIIERCRDWKESEVDARAWEAILQARSIYNKVKEVGRTLTNDF